MSDGPVSMPPSPGGPSKQNDKIVDFENLEYVGPVDDNLICPICKSPLYDASVTHCGHTFCKKCLSKAQGAD